MALSSYYDTDEVLALLKLSFVIIVLRPLNGHSKFRRQNLALFILKNFCVSCCRVHQEDFFVTNEWKLTSNKSDFI